MGLPERACLSVVLVAALTASTLGAAGTSAAQLRPATIPLSIPRSVATAINGHGQVAGRMLVGRHVHAFRWTHLTGLRDLGTLGGAYSAATGINGRGMIIGRSDVRGAMDRGEAHAFAWSAATGMRDLCDRPSTVSAINDRNQVAGSCPSVAGPVHAFRWSPASGLHDLGALSGGTSEAFAMNASGDVVGVSAVRRGDSPAGCRAFLWTPAHGMRDLGTLGGRVSYAVAINDHETITGISYRAGVPHVFRWTQAAGMRDLGRPAAAMSVFIRAISDRGTIVGYARDIHNKTTAYSWTVTRGLQRLGTLGGKTSMARAVNGRGYIVGWATTACGHRHPVLWAAGTGVTDLGTLGGATGRAIGINRSGDIVGVATTPTGVRHAFVWIPRSGMHDLTHYRRTR